LQTAEDNDQQSLPDTKRQRKMVTTGCERDQKKELCVEKDKVAKARAHDKSLETYQARIVPA
jgi:hypothetical protein